MQTDRKMQKNDDKNIEKNTVFDDNSCENAKESSLICEDFATEQTADTEIVKKVAADEQEDCNTQENPCEQDVCDEKKEGILSEYSARERKRKNALEVVKKYCKRYFIDAFSGMAQGLFCTLIAGTILWQISKWCGDNSFAHVLGYIASIAKMLMGAGIGIGIAHKLGAKPLVIFTAAVTGLVGAFSGNLVSTLCQNASFTIAFGAVGNPIGAYVVSLLTVEIASLYAGKTKLDIILIPLGMMLMCLAGIFVAWPFIKLIDLLAKLIVLAIEAGAAVKIIVGVFVAVVMGILLTMPTSSAAIWVAIATSATALENPDVFAIAGGAAVAGCSAHMIGFAVASFRENGVGGLISQGVGTSMLQIPNIMKKPAIMVPEIVASAVCGLVAVLMGIRCNASGGGMGTSGLVGVFGTIDASLGIIPDWQLGVGIVLCMFVLPAAISFGVSELMRKTGAIKYGDQKLD